MVDSTHEHNTPDYWLSLGRFVQEFSEAEKWTHILLGDLIDKDPQVAGAVLQERLPLSAAIDALPSLYSIRLGAEHKAIRGLKMALAQLKNISRVRNDVLHNGTTFVESGAAMVKSVRDFREGRKEPNPLYALSVDVFDRMSRDCRVISGFLWNHFALYFHGEDGYALPAGPVDKFAWAFDFNALKYK